MGYLAHGKRIRHVTVGLDTLDSRAELRKSGHPREDRHSALAPAPVETPSRIYEPPWAVGIMVMEDNR